MLVAERILLLPVVGAIRIVTVKSKDKEIRTFVKYAFNQDGLRGTMRKQNTFVPDDQSRALSMDHTNVTNVYNHLTHS